MLRALCAISLSLWAGASLAQNCTRDDPIEGVNWAISDDGQGHTYALGGGGVFTSCDDGDSWAEPDVPRHSGVSLLIDPTDSAVIYYGTSSVGVYRSTDSARSFSQTGIGVITDIVGALAATGGGAILAGTPSGIYKSTDRGDSWSLMNGSPSGAEIRALLVDPFSDNIIFAGTNGNGLMRTTDGGVTWSRVGTFASVHDLDFDALNSSVILASAWDGVWQSSDAGTTWSNLGGIRFMDLAIDPSSPLTLYRGQRHVRSRRGFHFGAESGDLHTER